MTIQCDDCGSVLKNAVILVDPLTSAVKRVCTKCYNKEPEKLEDYKEDLDPAN